MDNKDIILQQGETSAILSQSELYNDACSIIEQAQVSAYRSVDEIIIKRNWLLGLRIHHEILKDHRAEFGERVIKNLSKSLTAKYGSGFTKTNLYNYIGFYQNWPEFFHAVSGKSIKEDFAKYLTFMPTQEELRREIEQQKEFYRLQNEK